MKKDEVISDLTLMLLKLTSWDEAKSRGKKGQRKQAAGEEELRAWKGYDFEVLDALAEDGFIVSSHTAKSARLTKAGSKRADECLKKYGIEIDQAPAEQKFFRMNLRFDFDELSCVRTLLVPEHTTFEDFHTMIQACMNWMNYHLYDFQLVHGKTGNKLRFAWPDYDTGGDPMADYWSLEENPEETCGAWIDSATAYLDEYFPAAKRMVYSYDYGDGWTIDITMLNRGERFASDVPFCWEGVGDAPPEDVGGEGGFEEFLRVIEDESDFEFEHLSSWGKAQGFERFSKRAVNKRLEHWKDWARIEDGQPPRGSENTQVPAGNGSTDAGPDCDFGRVDGHGGCGNAGDGGVGVGGRDFADARDSDADDRDLDSYDDYQARVDELRKENARYLDMFEVFLAGSGISRKTINKHLDNIEFYLNDYLNYYGATDMRKGVRMVGGFLGDWFIRKCTWSSKTSIKEYGASLKKFYKCMAYNGLVSMREYNELKDEIKGCMPDWLDELEAYWDPNSSYWDAFRDLGEDVWDDDIDVEDEAGVSGKAMGVGERATAIPTAYPTTSATAKPTTSATAKPTATPSHTASNQKFRAFTTEKPVQRRQHVGVLAGLDDDERERIVKQRVTEMLDLRNTIDFIGMILEECTKGPVKTSLVDLALTEKKALLARWSKMLGLPYGSSLNKRQLVDALIPTITQSDAIVTSYLKDRTPSDFQSFKALYEQGGIMRVRKDEVKSLIGIPYPMPFVCYAFDEGVKGTFAFVIPDEIVALLDHVDWDVCESELAKQTAIVDIADALVELRGLVGIDEAYEEYCRVYPDGADLSGFMDAIMYASARELAGCEFVDDGEIVYLAHPELATQFRDENGLGAREETGPFAAGKLGSLNVILDGHRGKPGRTLDADMRSPEALFDWKLAIPAVRALRDYLDAHVPDDQDDYFFADATIEEMLDFSEFGLLGAEGRRVYFEILEDHGFVPAGAQEREVGDLIANMVNAVPNWMDNGWAPNEVNNAYESKKVFYNPDGSVMKVGRNDPCPCGSGKKYKKCCGR